MKTSNTKRGFTLIEILIVVAIIAILASAALIGLGPVQRSGRDARRVSDLRQTQNGLELYYAKCGFYPGTAACAAQTAPADWAALSAAITGSNLGISSIPKDPRSTQTYVYGATGSSYTLGATLESSSTALNDDIDGSSNGIACNDPVYCISL